MNTITDATESITLPDLMPPLLTIAMVAAMVTMICPPMQPIHGVCLFGFVAVAAAAVWLKVFPAQVRGMLVFAGICLVVYLASHAIPMFTGLRQPLVIGAFVVGLANAIWQRRNKARTATIAIPS
jgi:hypothetical protein